MQRTITILVTLACSVGHAIGADPPVPSDVEDPFAYARSDAERIKVSLQADKTQELQLRPGPLYTSYEVIRRWQKGTSWVWGGKGRPAVFLNMTTLGNTRYYEFNSLASEPLDVDTGHGTRWVPGPGWSPLAINEAPAPADDRRSRMFQMRSLARRFAAHTIDQYEDGARHNLQLLPQPVYRYVEESDESLDGAIFAFHRDRDVEAILVLDATKQDGKARWMFDCKRVTVHEVVVAIDGEVVWRQEPIPFSAATPRSVYHIFSRPARPDEK